MVNFHLLKNRKTCREMLDKCPVVNYINSWSLKGTLARSAIILLVESCSASSCVVDTLFYGLMSSDRIHYL